MKRAFEEEANDLNISRLELFKKRCGSILSNEDLKYAAAYGGKQTTSDSARYDQDINDQATGDSD
jgi:hypothetical protein